MVGRCRCCHYKSPRALHRHGVRYRAAVWQEPASASPRTNQHLTPGPPWDSGESGVRTPQSDAQPVNTQHISRKRLLRSRNDYWNRKSYCCRKIYRKTMLNCRCCAVIYKIWTPATNENQFFYAIKGFDLTDFKQNIVAFSIS